MEMVSIAYVWTLIDINTMDWLGQGSVSTCGGRLTTNLSVQVTLEDVGGMVKRNGASGRCR